jgi:hypothetical protein
LHISLWYKSKECQRFTEKYLYKSAIQSTCIEISFFILDPDFTKGQGYYTVLGFAALLTFV